MNIPQHPPMRLIDSVLQVNAELACCYVTIKEDNIFYNPTIQGIYAWVGIELMAQTIGVFASSRNPYQEPQIGFLISVRKFSSRRPYFRLGESLTIIAHREYLEAEMGVFQCEIFVNEELIASAKLSVFQPQESKNV